MRKSAIVNFNWSIPIVLAVINDINDRDKNLTNSSLASKDIALVVGASSGRRKIFGVEASLELHFWTSGALPMPAFTKIVLIFHPIGLYKCTWRRCMSQSRRLQRLCQEK